MVDVQDELCALPYDTYTLEELPAKGNQGYELVKVPNITISRNNTTIYLGTIDDQFEACRKSAPPPRWTVNTQRNLPGKLPSSTLFPIRI